MNNLPDDPLPTGWTWIRFEDILTFLRNGISIKPDATSGVPILRISAVRPFAVNMDNIRYLSGTLAAYSDYVLERGDLLFTRYNGNPDLVGVCGVVMSDGEATVHPDKLIRAKVLRDLALPEYLQYALNTGSSRQFLSRRVRTTAGQSGVSGGDIRAIPVPLPPLNEQHRIVAAIETQFTRLDAAVAALERTRANLKRYRAAVLKAACAGRLVPTEAELARAEGRDFESGDQLLARIQAEARDATASHHRGARSPNTASRRLPRGGERPALTPISLVNQAEQSARFQPPSGGLSGLSAGTSAPRADGREDPMRNGPGSNDGDVPVAESANAVSQNLPEGWAWTTLGQLLRYLRNGISTKPDAMDGTPILRISAVRPMSLNITDRRFLSGPITAYADYVLEPGDLLFTRYNGNPELVGVCAVVRSMPQPTVHPDKLIRAKVREDAALSRFLEIALNVGESRNFLARRVRTTAGQSGISGGDLRSMPVPIPPLAEQHRIVAEVERRLSVIDDLEKTFDANLKRAERLRQAILARAFAGNLVPQDPTDESASVLLERIRAERAVNEVPARRSRKGSRAAQMQERLL
jgi:type I restriction enzyme S subunit